MRKIMLTSLAAVAMLSPHSSIIADDADLFTSLDSNKDGYVTKDEVPAERQRLFQRLLRSNDKDSDGKLSRAEFIAAPQEPPGAAPEAAPGRDFNPAEVFKRLDRDGDDKLTKEEAPERMRENFDRIDGNGDGNIDLAEFRAVAARLAGGAPARPAAEGDGPGQSGAAVLIRLLDADGNGELSAEEIANAPKVLLKLDRNGDGKLSRDELPAPPPGGPQGRPNADQMRQRLKQADRNGDGKIQKDEAPPGLAAMFDRVDENGDGELDEKEIRAMLERFNQGPGSGGDQPRVRPKP
jgi:Ca2+-binding EF-hand superfamily protein